MSLSKKIAAATGTLMLLGSFSASAMQTIFAQDFENGLGGNPNANGATEKILIDAYSDGTLEASNSVETRFENCSASECPFSVTRAGDTNPAGQVRNFNIHHESTNPYAGGNMSTSNPMKYSPGMEGQVLGHVRANYNDQEDNYYQVDNISFDDDLGNITLMFDFDSWIQPDGYDAFAVAINDGSGWDLLTPSATDPLNEMEYTLLNANSDIKYLTGQPDGNGDVYGFVGFDVNGDPIDMAGTAIFDIADSYAGDTVSLRFAWASEDDWDNQEGINIDNIKVTGVCTTGEGPNCDSPGGSNSLPAPASLALAAFGVMAVRRRRIKR